MQQRKRYLIIILIAFIVGFLFLGLDGINESIYWFDKIVANKIIVFIYHGVFGGYVMSSIANAIILGIHFLKKLTIVGKITLIVLFPMTMLIAFFVGFMSLIPCVIFNIKKILEKNP